MQCLARCAAALAAATSLSAAAATTPMSRLTQYEGSTAQGSPVTMQVMTRGRGHAVVQQVYIWSIGQVCELSGQGFGTGLQVNTAAPVTPERTAEIAVTSTAFVFTIDMHFDHRGNVQGRIDFTSSALTPDESRTAEVCPSGPVAFSASPSTGAASAPAAALPDVSVTLDLDAQGRVLRQRVQRLH